MLNQCQTDSLKPHFKHFQTVGATRQASERRAALAKNQRYTIDKHTHIRHAMQLGLPSPK